MRPTKRCRSRHRRGARDRHGEGPRLPSTRSRGARERRANPWADLHDEPTVPPRRSRHRRTARSRARCSARRTPGPCRSALPQAAGLLLNPLNSFGDCPLSSPSPSFEAGAPRCSRGVVDGTPSLLEVLLRRLESAERTMISVGPTIGLARGEFSRKAQEDTLNDLGRRLPVAHPLHHPLLARGTHGTGQQCCGVGPTPSSHMHRTSPERLKAPAGEPGAREQPCSISTAIEGDAGRTSATYRGVCPRASPKARVARPSCVCPGDPLRHRSAGSVLSDRWSGSVVLST